MNEQCDHEDCDCDVTSSRVEREGRVYCCEGCASGDGCTHASCQCAVNSGNTRNQRP